MEENLNKAVEVSKELVKENDGQLVAFLAGCVLGVPALALGTWFVGSKVVKPLCVKGMNKIKSRKNGTETEAIDAEVVEEDLN